MRNILISLGTVLNFILSFYVIKLRINLHWHFCVKLSWIYYISSHQGRSIKKGVLRNFTKFTEKHLCQSLFFNKVARDSGTGVFL